MTNSSNILAQLHVPVRQINEVFPTVVLVETEVDLHERTPLGSLRLFDEMQSDFLRRVIGFLGITLDTGTDDVFPRGGAATIARDNVIQIQVLPVEDVAAVLAGVAVALEDVVARELHFLLRHAVVREQQDHAREADAEGDGFN